MSEPGSAASPPVAPPRRSARGERTAERILDAAELVFAERGFEGASLRDVAQRVGIRIPSLYNHFSSKESLYTAVLTRCVRPLFEIFSDYLATRPEERSSDHLIRGIVAVLAAHPNLPRLVQYETLTGGQRLTPALRETIAPILAQGSEMARATSTWTSEDLPHVVLAMYNMVVGYFTVAPLYAELDGKDLLSDEAIERQLRILIQMTDHLFPAPNSSGAAQS